jgi:hypothetical protein
MRACRIPVGPPPIYGGRDRWPRHDFATEFEALLADEVRAHPDSVRMSWLESVASVQVTGFMPTDFLAGLRATEGFV